jgi:hypothetical protein
MFFSVILITCCVFLKLYSSLPPVKSLIFAWCVLCLTLAPGCKENEEEPTEQAQYNFSATIDLEESSEIIAVFYAEAPNANWAEEGSESLVFTVSINNRSVGSFVLPGMGQPHQYKLSLGTYSAGEHQVELKFDEENSPASPAGLTVGNFELRSIAQDDPDYSLFANSPSIYTYHISGMRNLPYASYNDLPISLGAQVSRNDNEITQIDYFLLTSDADGRHDLEPSDQISKFGFLFSVNPVLRLKFDEDREVERFYFDSTGMVQELATGSVGEGHVALQVIDPDNHIAPPESSLSSQNLLLFPTVSTTITDDDPTGAVAINVPEPFILSDMEMSRQQLTSNGLTPNSVYPSQSYNYLRIAYEVEADNDTLFFFQVNLLDSSTYKSYFDDMADIHQPGNESTAIELPDSTSSDRIETISIGINTNRSPANAWLLMKRVVIYRVLEDYSFEIIADFKGEISLDAELATWPVYCRSQLGTSCDDPAFFKLTTGPAQ